jgi:hypothetical protein
VAKPWARPWLFKEKGRDLHQWWRRIQRRVPLMAAQKEKRSCAPLMELEAIARAIDGGA